MCKSVHLGTTIDKSTLRILFGDVGVSCHSNCNVMGHVHTILHKK